MSELGRCWSTWESTMPAVSAVSAVAHRCDHNIGHAGMHSTQGMQWSTGHTVLTQDYLNVILPITADNPKYVPTPQGLPPRS